MTSRPQPVSQTSQAPVCRHKSVRSYYLASRKHRDHSQEGGLVLLLVLMLRAGGFQPVRHLRAAGYRCHGMLRASNPTAIMLRRTNIDCFLVFTGQESGV